MCGKMQASGLTEIIPFLCISATWGQHPASWFFTDAGLQALFSLLGPSWHQASHLEALNNWWLWHACLLIWQEILFYSYKVFLKKHLKLEGWCQQRTTRHTSLVWLSIFGGAISDRRAIKPQSHHWEIWVGEVLPMLVWLFPDTVSRVHQAIKCRVHA